MAVTTKLGLAFELVPTSNEQYSGARQSFSRLKNLKTPRKGCFAFVDTSKRP
jgi:hypothetical protein